MPERHIKGIATKNDYRDAEERAETLREWAAQEPDADQYELPDLEGSIPPCMRREALDEAELAHLMDKINDPLAKKLVDALLALDHLSAQAKRPELDDDIGQQRVATVSAFLTVGSSVRPHLRLLGTVRQVRSSCRLPD